MKKIINVFCLSALVIMTSCAVAFAAYRPIILTPNTSAYNIAQMFANRTGYRVYDVDPASSSFLYTVTISYDDLSEVCTQANSVGMSCSLYYNKSVEMYVIAVEDITLFGLSSVRGCIGNVDGKILIAKDSRVNITINTPTNPDYTDRLINIASNLDFLPIIAELNVLIADNQLLTMDYISLAIQGIWDLQDSMIDRFGIVSNRLAYIGSHIASVDVHVVDISDLLSSVIKENKVQINTTSLEARLDKLISMYSKVNSVVLDTASVNGGNISGAVGGELKDVVFWGDTAKYNNEFLTPDGLWYRFGDTVANTTLHTINGDIPRTMAVACQDWPPMAATRGKKVSLFYRSLLAIDSVTLSRSDTLFPSSPPQR